MTLPVLWPGDESDIHREAAKSVGEKYQSDRTWRHVKADGSEIEVLIYARRFPFAHMHAILVAVVDVTERKQAEARIAYMAHHDALTDLPNRVLFHERLNELLGAGARGTAKTWRSIASISIISRASTIRSAIRWATSCCRRLRERLQENACAPATWWRGSAATNLPSCSSRSAVRNDASTLADNADRDREQALRGPWPRIRHRRHIGIALAPGDGSDADVLLRNADMALYRAKAEGRGTAHFFEPEMDRRIQARRLLELDLRKAFANGEFELFYQPLISLQRQCRSPASRRCCAGGIRSAA